MGMRHPRLSTTMAKAVVSPLMTIPPEIKGMIAGNVSIHDPYYSIDTCLQSLHIGFLQY